MKYKLLLLLLMGVAYNSIAEKKSNSPNIILIFCDDLGFADLSSYGSVWNQTPEIDKMAVEGVRFTDFYAGAPVCTPSRASLMTGCYARRVDLDLDIKKRWVLFPKAQKGINPKEIILPEVLKEAGYATAIIGKWHLGDQPEFLPTKHGFDYYFGIPYSNDMGIKRGGEPVLPLMKNQTVFEKVNQKNESEMSMLTKRYTDETIQWIKENKKSPFFLYLAHTMPHNPVAAREQFHQQTSNPKKGFGASIAEISWSTGEILDYLKREKIADNTLVIFTSDNGGAPHWGANNGILKGRKGQTYEGGVRVPFIAWWPGKINPGTTSNSPASVLDLYPTFKALANIQSVDNTKRDGIDISSYFFNPEEQQEPRSYFYWHVGYLQAVRYGDWKLNLSSQFSEAQQQQIKKSTYRIAEFSDQLELYNLREDPREETDVSSEHPEMVSKILELAEREKKALGEFDAKGPEVRETMIVDSPTTLIK
ncbi:MAG: arylsulfatase A [Cyclobacteriaceae bacterium]|jgi:arylsulfatase A-like enzyme